MDTARVTIESPAAGRRRSLAGMLTAARRSPLAADAIFAVLMAALTLAGSLAESHPSRGEVSVGQHVPVAPAAAYLLVIGSALVLAWRRRAPLRVLVVSLAAAVAYTCLGYFNGSVILNPVVALYTVATIVPARRAIAASLATMLALMAATAAFDPLGPTGGGFILIPGVIAAALFLGLWVASSRAYRRRDSEERARRAVDAERLRIARELHDVVAHTMATINVQAGVAGHVVHRQPDEAAQALEAIRQASRDGLRELRGILDVLRQADERDPRAPAPGLAQLETLIDGTSRAGLPTTIAVQGPPRPVPAIVDLTAYRIVQESLTNALRYAGPTTATVTLSYDEHQLELEIVDRGRGPAAGATDDASGHGIAGMRERAVALGGTLHAGAAPDGGYRVHARLPLHTS